MTILGYNSVILVAECKINLITISQTFSALVAALTTERSLLIALIL